MNKIKIVNVVAKAVIAGHDNNTILKTVRNAEYRPNNFPAIGIKTAKAKIWLYNSGKVTSTGTNSMDEALVSITDFVHEMARLGMSIKMISEPRVVLVVANVFVSKKLDIIKMRHMVKSSQPRFTSRTVQFGDGKHARIYDNNAVIASASSIDGIIEIVKKLEKYQME